MKSGKQRLVIRSLRPREIPGMIEVWKASGLPYKPKGRDSLRNLRAQRAADPELFIGAFAGSEMMGVILASDDGRRAWINRLAVRPEVQRMGVASALVERAEKVMRKRGRKLFCAQIEADNDVSTRFFEQSGYRREHGIYYFTKRELKSY